MKISKNGLAVVKAFEGCHRSIGGGKFRSYLDPVNVLTIGYGHTNHHPPQISENTIWTQQQCDEQLARDMGIFERAVDRLVKVPLTQYEFDALVSFSYNVGDGNLSRSSLLRMVNSRNYAGAADEFHKWNKAGGRVFAGLTRRRKAESLLFQGKIPEALRVAQARSPGKDVAVGTGGGTGTVVAVGVQQGWGVTEWLMAAAFLVVAGGVAYFVIKKHRDKPTAVHSIDSLPTPPVPGAASEPEVTEPKGKTDD